MNKQTIITTLLALVAMAGQGQELKIDDQGEWEIDVRSGSQSQIKRVSASLEDFMEHMAMYGYDVFRVGLHHCHPRVRPAKDD